MANYPTRAQVESYIRSEAIARGINPDTAVAVANSEGLKADPKEGWQSNIREKTGKREPSYGPFQLYTGGGLGNEFNKQTGLDVKDWSTWQAQVQFALDHAAKEGWSKFHGAKTVVDSQWTGLENASPKGVNANPVASAPQAQAQAQAESYDPTSLQMGFMPGLAAQNTQPAKPFDGAVKADPVPQFAPADRPFPATQYAEVDPEQKGIDTVLTADGKMRVIPAPKAGMQAQWEAARINGMLFMAGRLASLEDARAAQSRFDGVREREAAEAGNTNKSVASPNMADIVALPDDLGPARPENISARMAPLLDSMRGASRLTKSGALSNMQETLQKHEIARQHYEFLTGKQMPPIADGIAKAGTSREKNRKGSQHFHGNALDYLTAPEDLGYKMSQFEKSALKEAFQIAGLPTVNFYGDGRRVHADPRPGGGFWSDARFQPGPLGDNISVPGAPIPTPAPRGTSSDSIDRASISAALSGPFGGVNFANGQSAKPQNASPSSYSPALSQRSSGPEGKITNPMYGDGAPVSGRTLSPTLAYAPQQSFSEVPSPSRSLSGARPSSPVFSSPLGFTSPTKAATGVQTYNRPSISAALSGPRGGVNFANGQIANPPGPMSATAAQYASYGAGKPVSDPLAIAASTMLTRPEMPPPSVPKSAQQSKPQTQLSEAEKAKQRAEAFLEENNLKGVTGKVVAQSLGQKIGSLLGNANVAQALGGLGGLVSGIAAPVGSNYQGEWTPAAGGNKVVESIGVGIGGENLSGVTNQYGATSMLGEGGSRTYGGPGGSSGK